VQLFVDQCWILETRKSEEDRDWDAILRLLDDVQQIGELRGGAGLLAATARARAVVLADHLARYAEAMEVIDTGLRNAETSEQFLLDYTAGCILLDHSTPARALERLHRALLQARLRTDSCMRTRGDWR
jgi:hypothetical protein